MAYTAGKLAGGVMTIRLKIAGLFVFLALVAGGSFSPAVANPLSYSRVDQVLDWGASTTRLIIDLGTDVSAASLSPDSFSVHVERRDKRRPAPLIDEGYRHITAAFVSDADGKPTAQGRHVTLELAVGPNMPLSHALHYHVDEVAGTGRNAWVDATYEITLVKPVGAVAAGTRVTALNRHMRGLVDAFEFGASSFTDPDYGSMRLTYAHFSPATDAGKNPLIIWLHGAGEGGTDPTVPLAANRAARFASPEIQAYFGGAYILVPQTPTRWMHGPNENPRVEKKDAQSIYSRAVQDLIERFVEARPDIDSNRIYVAGASNGGFMTVRLALDYPDFYAAAVPVCQALNPAYVPDAALAGIAGLPMWIVTAANDPVIAPDRYSAALYSKLLKAGSGTVKLSLLPHLRDQSGLYQNSDGKPYNYHPHFSWVPVFNNHIATIEGGRGMLYGAFAAKTERVGDSKVMSLMAWLAAQSRAD